MSEATKEVGMPAIVNFQERKLMKMIYELRDRTDLVTYAYLYNDFNGKFVFLGKAIGYGLPYSTQYTNPEKFAQAWQGAPVELVPQADPNGLFLPDNAEGTWVMLLNPKTGEPTPTYVEPRVLISQFPLPASEVQ